MQLNLLNQRPVPPARMREPAPATLARSTDPESSQDAAEATTRSGRAAGQRRAVLAALCVEDGATSAELAERMNVSRYMPARRLPELERLGYVRRGEARICAAHGTKALTWWVR